MVRSTRNASWNKKRLPKHAPGCRRSSKCRSVNACRKAVYESNDPTLRAGKLSKRQLVKNRAGKVVSRVKSMTEKRKYNNDPGHPLRFRNDIVKAAMDRMDELYDMDELVNTGEMDEMDDMDELVNTVENE